MASNGWIKLHRKLLESLIFGNEKGLKVWIWCLLKANHADKQVLLGRRKIILKAGQFIMGSTTAKEQLSLAKATIWYWLNFLEKEGQVRLEKTTKYTIVTIPKWEEYQHELDTNETQSERKVGTNKNEENVKNTSVAIAPREFDIVSDIEREVRAKPAPKYPNARTVFEWFPNRQKAWDINTTELKHAELLFERGERQVKRAIEIAFEYRKDPYCPDCTKPSFLEQKWSNLIRFAGKKGV